MVTPLYGFTGNEVQLLGQIKLTVSLGEKPLMRTRRSYFMVVDAPSAYNVILGRPTLNEFRAIVSTFCQKVKFPVDDQVGEVRGDQLLAQKCYVEIIRTEANVARKAQRMEVNAIQEKPPNLIYEEKEEVQIQAGDQKLLVKQKKRDFGADQNKIIKEEVDKLLEAGYIREVQYPNWLANVVLVPKPGNKWRVCIDFQDLNKACPKDYYPLSRIDQVVDSTAGCEYICMLDAYQGYHQVPLAKDYQEKVVDLCRDIEETCRTLRQYGRKLNPGKCLFGARSGKFLGYMEIERGIEANPNKVRNQFGGGPHDDPNHHLELFYEICGSMKVNEFPPESVRLLLFGFSLKDRAKQ
ncbi:uncharacterized protein LOC122019218 [Zingiber officinale]|uniref:uncharacterized protein LOC122019218 n=1 Tax=Zingiber officinale TaxID=94328 RepID=UPI001C4C1C7D|nr:uncharacterized protein LOC122019218 [Zingiber officinale]